MENQLLCCPLCCGRTFSSKHALLEHLSNIGKNFRCPLCSNNFTSVALLVDHLRTTDCSTQDIDIPLASNIDHQSLIQQQNNELIQTNAASGDNENSIQTDDFHASNVEDHDMTELTEETLEANNIYAEIMQKYPDKQFPGADLHLLEENGHSKYTIVAHDGVPAIMSSGTVITKQNSDGTISITTLKDDMKMEPEPVITVTEKDSATDGDEGIYSCNMCGVSFFSVLEHIQDYHKDQDVVVEMNEQSNPEESPSIEIVTVNEAVKASKNPELNSINSTQGDCIVSEPTEQKCPQMTDNSSVRRRVITDTGDIVETSGRTKSVTTEIPNPTKEEIDPLGSLASLEMEVYDKKGRVFRRKLVQIDKLNNTNTEAEQPAKQPPKQPFHQVVVKEIVTMDGNEKMKVYNCIACHIYVTELDEFKSHPCKLLKYSCPHCPVSYENAKSLCAHMKVHKVPKPQNNIKFAVTGGAAHVKKESSPDTVPIGGPYKCDICCTVFPTNKSLKLHKRMHDPIKPRSIDPPIQEEITEENSEKYFCTVCTKWIPSSYRDIHSNFHDATENFNCEICNKKFESSNYLAMHMGVHNMDKAFSVKNPDKSLPYTCKFCSRQFARPHEKVKHERIHTGEKPHSCEICGKSFRVSYCLTLHMRTHTGARPYECQHCGKRFKAHSVYNHHLLTHSDVRAYKCPYCPKAFKTSVQLAGHKNSHTKPFACVHCNRPFASLYAVRVHQETHRRQNNLKFSCTLCGASYARSFALKDHVKQAHNTDIDNPDTFEAHRRQNNLKFSCTLCAASYTRSFALKDHVKQAHNTDIDNPDTFVISKEDWGAQSEKLDSKEDMQTEITTLEISPNEEAVIA